MLVPAAIYLCFNWNGSGQFGWGIPMATDIAFVVGIMALLGKRVPFALKIFLVALAIVDDIGAVLVIATFYTHHLNWFFLFLGLVTVLLLSFYNRIGIKNSLFYPLFGIFLWVFVLKSGIHATIAGVLLAVTIPTVTGKSLEKILHPFVTFGIMPLFALANAGVTFPNSSLVNSVSLGVILGLVLGKQIGITLFSWIAVKMKLAHLPGSITWWQVYGAACLGGIGFTMSLFIANLALRDGVMVDAARVGILVASFLSGLFGAGIILVAQK